MINHLIHTAEGIISILVDGIMSDDFVYCIARQLYPDSCILDGDKIERINYIV